MQKNPFGWNTLAIEPTPKRSQGTIRNKKYHEEPEKTQYRNDHTA